MADSRNQPELETLDCKPKPTIAELEEILERDGSGSIEIMPNGEIRTMEKCHNPICAICNPEPTNTPEEAIDKLFPLPEQPNLKIIEEIESLISQVNEKLDALVITDKEPGDSARKWRKNMALEEIDLFQKITLRELKQVFE